MASSRRHFLASVAALAVPVLLGPRRAFAGSRQDGLHPDPRPGIDGSRVLTAKQLEDAPDVIPYFDKVRRIPQIADGIRCQCDCHDIPGFRSLLSCFEGDGMARHCVICQGQGQLAYDLHRQGKSLKAIRTAIDEEFG